MGRGQGLNGQSNLLTVVVLVLNAVCGILGGLLFSLAMWMRLETEVKDWVRELNMTQYWTGLYILMAAGAIIMIISFCGCCGALTDNSCLLGTNVSMSSLTFVLLVMGATILLANVIRPSIDMEQLRFQMKYILEHKDLGSQRFMEFLFYRSAVLVLLALILELAGAIYLLVNGTESSQLTPFLERTFNKLMIDSNYNDQANRILQVVQERIGCCGANNYQDYQRNNLPISDYCRDAVSGNLYNEGCVQQLSIFIEKRAGWLAGISLFVGVLQMFLVCATFCFWRNMGDERRDGGKIYTAAGASERPY